VDAGNNRVLEYDSPFDQCAKTPCVLGKATRVFGQNGVSSPRDAPGRAAIPPTPTICASTAASFWAV